MMSKYVETLSAAAKKRYWKKISLIGNIDPFTLSGKNTVPGVQATATWPPVTPSDLVSYLVLQTSFATLQQFKSHKSLEAYNQFTSGWVKDVKCWKVLSAPSQTRSVVTGRVSVQCRCVVTTLY